MEIDMDQILFIAALFFACFIITAWAFGIYIGVKPAFKSLHWSTKLIYVVPVVVGYLADVIAGFMLTAIWYREVPDIYATTLSQTTQRHFWDSKLAAFLFSEINKSDPGHIGGIPRKP